MLDYSDEEEESSAVRKRNHSPEPQPVDLRSPFSPSERDENQLPIGFTARTQSIFKEFKEKSSGMIMPTSGPPITDAFIISEFIPGKVLKPAFELRNFGLDLKANGSDFHDSSDKFSPNIQAHPDSFYKSMSILVLLAQFFAVLPVSGIRGLNDKSLRFKWIHYKTLYWAFAFLGAVFCCVCTTISGLHGGLFEAASAILYFASGILSSLLMLSLSRNWRNVNEEFAQIELAFKKYGYPRKIGVKFKIVTIVFLLVALVEHILSKLKSFTMVLKCSQKNYDFSSMAESFFLSEYNEVFTLNSYSFWKGGLVLTAHFLVTANWNFKDLFLTFISWTIAERFKQVHDFLDSIHGQDKSVSFWKEVREDFNKLSVLTKRIDAYTQKLMFISIGNNLFFICMQLFHSLREKVDSFRLIYFFWSFGFLVLRTGFVAFSAARINDESKEPKTVLYSVPQKNYTAEVRRFLTQLTTNEVALTGSGFFSITRSLILTITGSVITYEIVLVQFGTSEAEDVSRANQTFCLRK